MAERRGQSQSAAQQLSISVAFTFSGGEEGGESILLGVVAVVDQA